jgi:hypothetical protein
MLRVLSRRYAAGLELQPDDAELAEIRRRFRERRGLDSDKELEAWLDERRIAAAAFDTYMEDMARLSILVSQLEVDVRALVPNEIRLAADDPTEGRVGWDLFAEEAF